MKWKIKNPKYKLLFTQGWQFMIAGEIEQLNIIKMIAEHLPD